jgi:hypothetical protein
MEFTFPAYEGATAAVRSLRDWFLLELPERLQPRPDERQQNEDDDQEDHQLARDPHVNIDHRIATLHAADITARPQGKL